jgi:hypothetical protein
LWELEVPDNSQTPLFLKQRSLFESANFFVPSAPIKNPMAFDFKARMRAKGNGVEAAEAALCARTLSGLHLKTFGDLLDSLSLSNERSRFGSDEARRGHPIR